MKLIKLNKNIFCISVLVVLILIIGFVLCTKVTEAFTQTSKWEKCATEGEVCKGNGMVKYCEIADPTRCSQPKRIFDSIDCNNSVFGDIRKGQKKECLIKRGSANKKHSNKKHLVNYAKPDPNIQPTPPKDYCLGDLKNLDNKPMGYFQSNPDANYLVKPMDKSSITVYSIDECEANCNLDDGCVGIKYDINKAYEQEKEGGDLGPNCTRYVMAKAGDEGAISATSICTHLVGGDIINNGVPSGVNCSKPFQKIPNDYTRLQEYGQTSHTTEGACAYECSIRLDAQPPCEAYYFDQNNRGGNNCKIFTRQSLFAPNQQSFAFPKSMFCSTPTLPPYDIAGFWIDPTNKDYHIQIKFTSNKISKTEKRPFEAISKIEYKGKGKGFVLGNLILGFQWENDPNTYNSHPLTLENGKVNKIPWYAVGKPSRDNNWTFVKPNSEADWIRVSDPGSDVYEKNKCNGKEYWHNTKYNFTNAGNISEQECSSKCASNENCDQYLINPQNNNCLFIKFNPDNVSTSKCSSFPDGRYYGRIKKTNNPNPALPAPKSCEDNPKGWNGLSCSKLKRYCTPKHPFWYEGLPQLCPKTCNQC